LFTFNASSFPLDPSVESYLKSKGALSLDFGRFAYINSEMMPAVLLDLIESNKTDAQSSNSELVAQLEAEIGRYSAERQKMLEDTSKLVAQVKSYSAEISTLKAQASESAKMVEALKAENARLQSITKSAPPPNAQSTLQPSSATADDRLRQSYEKLLKDFQMLRSQNAETITSLKVLEDENEELMQELERLRHQLNASSPKAG